MMKRLWAVFLLASLFSSTALAAVTQVYWTDRNNGVVSVTDIATGQTAPVISGFTRLQDIDLDYTVGALYFADWGQPGPPGGQGSINRVNPDGTGLALILATGDAVHQLALDEVAQHIYYSRAVSYDNREIARIDMTGANFTPLFTGGWFLSGLALDVANNALYWGDVGVISNPPNGSVNTMTLVGGAPTQLTPYVVGQGRGMAIDLATQTIFLTSHNPQSPTTGGALHSYDIATGQLTQLISDPTTGYWDVELDTAAQRVWWADAGRGEIRSADYNGGNVQIEAAGLTNVYGIALDFGTIDTSRAMFPVSKAFSDGEDFPVEVTLTCNSGLPLQQSFVISPGQGVTFTLTNIPAGGADCTITETDGADGYTPSYDNGTVISAAGCTHSGVGGGMYSCDITNSPSTFDFVVDFEWDDTAEDATGYVDVSLYCVNVLNSTGGLVTTTLSSPDNPFTADATSDTEFEWLAVGAPNDDEDSDGDPIDPTTCWAMVDYIDDMTVEVTGCDPFTVSPGEDEANCTLTATVFFEGIPTLSQYGMAILALLMLGVGFVGMRRFV